MSFYNNYFFVDSKDFIKKLWISKRSADFLPQYYSNGEISSKIIFFNNGIPEEYHKIVMKSDLTMLFKRQDFCEFISGVAFYSIKHKKNVLSDYIDANCMPFFNSDNYQWFYNYVSFKSFINYCSYQSVLEFFKKISADGFLELYFLSLMQIFDLNQSAVDGINKKYFVFQKTLKK